MPGGREVPVTESNKVRYIHLVANHHLNGRIRQQSAAFLSGLQMLVKPEWTLMFSEEELQTLISGSREALDLRDLVAHSSYSGGYYPEHPTIRLLWEVVGAFPPAEQRLFLKFVTACSRPPLLGFRHLEPGFCVHRSGVGGSNAPDHEADVHRLPTSVCRGPFSSALHLSRLAARDATHRWMKLSAS